MAEFGAFEVTLHKKRKTVSHAPAELVTKTVLNHLAQKNPGSPEQPGLIGETRVSRRPWSTLYFFTVLFSGEPKKVVAKIARFIDQTSAEVSWQSKELLDQGRNEFDTASFVFTHFAGQPNTLLRSLQPLAYIPEINATLMEFSFGARMNGYLKLWRQLFPRSRWQTIRLMQHAGQWLRCLHAMPAPFLPGDLCFLPVDTFQQLQTDIDHLRYLGVTLPKNVSEKMLPALAQVSLAQVSDEERVWNHGDFTTGNLLVFSDEGVLALDVVMNRFDSPYYDLGRFVGDLQTRRNLILRWGWLSSVGLMNHLRDAFLSGYFNCEPYNKPLLALYEGYFIFHEWLDTLAFIQSKFTGHKAVLSHLISWAIINPAFRRVVKKWAETALAATPTLEPST
jgi:hypothetical protein